MPPLRTYPDTYEPSSVDLFNIMLYRSPAVVVLLPAIIAEHSTTHTRGRWYNYVRVYGYTHTQTHKYVYCIYICISLCSYDRRKRILRFGAAQYETFHLTNAAERQSLRTIKANTTSLHGGTRRTNRQLFRTKKGDVPVAVIDSKKKKKSHRN